MIINLTGAKGVGKTFLAHRLKSERNKISIIEEFVYRDTGFDVRTKYGFLQNEKIYCEEKMNYFNEANNKSEVSVFVRGMEDLLFYISSYPSINNFNWKIDSDFQDILKQIDNCKSDLIIYLDACKEVLEARWESDSVKKRVIEDTWYEKWYMPHKKFIQNYKNTIVLDTSYLTKQDVFERVNEIIDNSI
ncbi:MAG: ATP-binding protein [Ruminococcus sp.]|nr:ATP-binding protein [Ruminococcus sp.]